MVTNTLLKFIDVLRQESRFTGLQHNFKWVIIVSVMLRAKAL